MQKAAIVTIQLARFDAIRDAGTIEARGRPGVLFSGVAADLRAGRDGARLLPMTWGTFSREFSPPPA